MVTATARDVGNSNRQSGWLLPSTRLMRWLTKLNTAVDSSDDDTNKHMLLWMLTMPWPTKPLPLTTAMTTDGDGRYCSHC